MKFDFEGKEYYIDGYLASQLDSIVYNIREDWDIVIIITGDRTVRVGKSVLAMTICAYLASALKNSKVDGKVMNENAYTMNDIYFNSTVMITEAQEKPKYAISHYDEARESLASTKHAKKAQQDVVDFFNECGQLNQIFVLVLPDFFGLKEDMAVARSEFLLNVYRTETKKMIDLYHTGEKRPVVKFERGRFQFFNRTKKSNLLDKSKSMKRKSYSLIKADFIGRFTNQYPLDEKVYKELKRESLKRFNESHKKEDVKVQTETRKFLEIASFLTPNQLKEMSLKLDRNEDYFRKAVERTKREADPVLSKENELKARKIGEIEGFP